MGWYRRSKLAFEAFHIIASKFQAQKPNPHNFTLASPISRTSAFQFGPKQGQSSCFLLGTRRNYYVGPHHQAQHFRGQKWLPEPEDGGVGGVRSGDHGIHTESIRVRVITRDIIEALQWGLRKDNMWSDLRYAVDSDETLDDAIRLETLLALSEGIEKKWRKDDEILDDKWVEESRKRAKKHGDEPDVGHLEVGHCGARHSAGQITKNLWFAILQLVLVQYIMPDLVYAMSTLLLRLPFSRRMEMEADYIGLLLMASAGYDPRVAPLVYEKLGKVTGESSSRDYLLTHPSGKTRAQMLAQAKVMEEAVVLYREALVGEWVRGFL